MSAEETKSLYKCSVSPGGIMIYTSGIRVVLSSQEMEVQEMSVDHRNRVTESGGSNDDNIF